MRWLLLGLLLAGPAWSQSTDGPPQTVVATRTIRANTVLGPGDVTLTTIDRAGALSDPAEAIGLEARVTLYAGRPIHAADLMPPAIVDRNQIITLAYETAGLKILTEGRALARGGEGEVIRVMNLSSRTTVFGRIATDGSVQVGPQD